jgi:putative transposase
MVKRCKPKSDGQGGWLPNGASAKTGLNRSISDVGWGQFISILKVKAEDAGRKIVGVNPAYTSIRCHKCQSVCVRPSQDVVVCEVHGSQDADLNGALNVFFRAGLGSTISIGNCLL